MIQQVELSDALYEVLDQRSFYPTPLGTSDETENQQAPNIWKVISNIEVEPDL